jgi:hypothetical protein
MKIPVYSCFLFIIISLSGFSQDTLSNRIIPRKNFDTDTLSHMIVPGKIINGDTLPYVDLNTFTVFPQVTFDYNNELMKYQQLVYRVKKVYPYAKLAAKKLEEYKKILDTIPSHRGKKQFIKKAEKELEAQFGDEIKKLSFSQGKILIKLIYRETGSSTFEIVKELRGGFSAYIWQTMARVFGYDLKTTYDPENEDQMIEKIVRMIDAGVL